MVHDNPTLGLLVFLLMAVLPLLGAVVPIAYRLFLHRQEHRQLTEGE